MGKQIISKAIGIDLGTTNSVVAIMNPNDTEIIIHKEGRRETTPSCVWKDPKSGQINVGAKAFSRFGRQGDQPIKSIKREMGKVKKVKLADDEKTPEEISSYILAELKRQIEPDVAKLGTTTTEWAVDRAIVTVPAHFDQPQIDATRKAAEMAGLQVLELLHEPTAAACYYCWSTNTRNGNFLVYDLGGGTFDVSILRCIEGEFEVVAISGNKHLGGDNLDDILAEEIRKRLCENDYDFDLDNNDQEDQIRKNMLKRLAEGVKIALSTADETILRSTTDLQDKSGEDVLIEMTFERQELEQFIRATIERTLPYCDEALEQAEHKAGITLANIDQIILAGGSTHIPLVREMVKQHLCADPSTREPRAKCSEPVYKKVDTMVGLGAAIRAAATGSIITYNAEKTVRLTFRGMGATDAKHTHIGGTAESLSPQLNLKGGQIQLTIPDLNFEDEQELKTNGAFGFTRLPLQPDRENLLTFAIYDRQGNHITTIERYIYQSRETLHPTGGSTGTAIISKEISLGVNWSGDENPFLLINALETLPIKHTLSNLIVPDNVERVRLPFYQGEGQKKIQEIYLPHSMSILAGQKAELTVAIDKLSHLTVNCKIGEQHFELEIKLPAPRSLPTDEEIQKLNSQFSSKRSSLPVNKRHLSDAKYRHARKSLEEAQKRGDHDQVIHDFEEMEEVAASIQEEVGILQPSKETFNDLVTTCQDLNKYVLQESYQHAFPSYDYKGLSQAIEEHRILGTKAFDSTDQVIYSDSINMLESIRDHLLNLIRSVAELKDTRTEQQKVTATSAYYEQEATKLETLASKNNNVAIQEQIQQIKTQLQEAAREARDNPQEAKNNAIKSAIQLEQLKNILENEATPTGIEDLLKYQG